jgi:hypothetical protein
VTRLAMVIKLIGILIFQAKAENPWKTLGELSAFCLQFHISRQLYPTLKMKISIQMVKNQK